MRTSVLDRQPLLPVPNYALTPGTMLQRAQARRPTRRVAPGAVIVRLQGKEALSAPRLSSLRVDHGPRQWAVQRRRASTERSILSWIAAPFQLIGKAVLRIAQNLVGGLTLVGTRVISALQMLVGLERVGRKLTGDEVQFLRRIYGDSIDYGAVRIKEGFAGVFSVNDRPFVLGNTIYLKGKGQSAGRAGLGATHRALLAHEMCHVWQYQTRGTGYLVDAVFNQLTKGQKAYDWRRAVPQKPWSALAAEQQAAFIEDAVRFGCFDRATARPWGETRRSGRVDYAAYLKNALVEIRAG